jgi:hypothetical protein
VRALFANRIFKIEQLPATLTFEELHRFDVSRIYLKTAPTAAIADAVKYVASRESFLPARKLRTLGQENPPARAGSIQIHVDWASPRRLQQAAARIGVAP